ncbi:MAG: tetratricopeptide repeat protein [Candidatus Micrarchaeota archaeon]
MGPVKYQKSVVEDHYDEGYKKGNYDSAIQEYTKAIELNPKNADAYFNRGLCYEKQGKYDLAIQDYKKTIKLNPENLEAQNNLRKLEELLTAQNITKNLILAILSNDNKTIAGIEQDPDLKKGKIREKINNYCALFAKAKDTTSIETALSSVGFNKNERSVLKQTIGYNFSNVSDFASFFENGSTIYDIIANYNECYAKVENYISIASGTNIYTPQSSLSFGQNQEAVMNFFVRKHFGMTKNEMIENFGQYIPKDKHGKPLLNKLSEVGILQKFVDSTLNKSFFVERGNFFGKYSAEGEDMFSRMDLLSQRAFLSFLPVMEDNWGVDGVRILIGDQKNPGLSEALAVMPKQSYYALFAENVYVDGEKIATKGTLRAIVESGAYGLDEIRTRIIPAIALRLNEVYDRAGAARERSAFTFTIIGVQDAFQEAQKAIFKAFIEQTLKDPASFSALLENVPEPTKAELKRLIEAMEKNISDKITEVEISPNLISTLFDFYILNPLQPIDSAYESDTTKMSGGETDRTLSKFLYEFSPYSFQLIPDKGYKKVTYIIPSIDEFVRELSNQEIPFLVKLPTTLTYLTLGGGAIAKGKNGKSETSVIAQVEMIGTEGASISGGVYINEDEKAEKAFRIIANDIKTPEEPVKEIQKGEFYVCNDQLRAALDSYFNFNSKQPTKENFARLFYEKNADNSYLVKAYVRNTNGTWYRYTFNETADNIKSTFLVYFSANADVRALIDNNKLEAFVVGLKSKSGLSAAVLKGMNSETLAEQFGAIIGSDTTDSKTGEHSMTFIRAYSEEDKKEMGLTFKQESSDKTTASFWDLVYGANKQYGIDITWRTNNVEFNPAYITYLSNLETAARTNIAYIGLGSDLAWIVGSYVKNATGNNDKEYALTGAIEWETSEERETPGKWQKSQKTEPNLQKLIRHKLQFSTHTSKSTAVQAQSAINDNIATEINNINTASETLAKPGISDEELSKAWEDYRNARAEIENLRGKLKAINLLIAEQYMGTFKYKLTTKDGETFGFESIIGKEGEMFNAYAIANGGGWQAITSLGNTRGIGGKIIKPLDLAVAFITGGVIVNNEFGSKLLLYGGYKKNKEKNAYGGEGIIVGASRETRGTLNKDIKTAEAVVFSANGYIINGEKLGSSGKYIAIKYENGKYYANQMNELEFNRNVVRGAVTLFLPGDDYGSICTMDCGGEFESGKNTSKETGGTIKYHSIGLFLSMIKKSIGRNYYIDAGIRKEWDKYIPTGVKGSIWIFELGGSARIPIYYKF